MMASPHVALDQRVVLAMRSVFKRILEERWKKSENIGNSTTPPRLITTVRLFATLLFYNRNWNPGRLQF
jgi:hypothetical protein